MVEQLPEQVLAQAQALVQALVLLVVLLLARPMEKQKVACCQGSRRWEGLGPRCGQVQRVKQTSCWEEDFREGSLRLEVRRQM